jgi:23S rRNA (adenine2503-C2)-methyltransferase
MSESTLADALGLEPEEWSARLEGWAMPRYRGEQVFRALHQGRLEAWSELRQLPPAARGQLAEAFPLTLPRIARRIESTDGAIRYLLSLADGEQIEAVYLPDEVFDAAGGVVRRRTTFCISSQAGCAVNCQFCMTATLGLRRSLTAGEIVGQVLRLLGEHGLRPGRGLDRVNLVFMGMGEPFLNYDQVVRAIRVLTRAEGAGIAPRRITVSTAGIVDKIRRWGQEAFPRARPNLAISLNASSDAQRQRLMPLNRGQGGLDALLAAVRELPLGPREYVTFEYVLLAGENDQPADAERVLELLRGLRAKVNLIAWNAGGGLPFAAPAPEAVLALQRRLIAGGIATYIRRPRGRDIYAACGQLAKS